MCYLLYIVMMKKLILIFLVILLFSCSSRYSKKHHIGTLVIDNQLYYEMFQTYSGGSLASDTYSDYVTDSSTFRKYVGSIFYDDQQLRFKLINKDSLLIFTINRHKLNDTIEQKVYIISKLKKEGRFE